MYFKTFAWTKIAKLWLRAGCRFELSRLTFLLSKQYRHFYLTKRGFDRASKCGRLVKENTRTIYLLGMTVLAVTRSCFGFKTLFREFTLDEFAQNDLAMVQYAKRQAFSGGATGEGVSGGTSFPLPPLQTFMEFLALLLVIFIDCLLSFLC